MNIEILNEADTELFVEELDGIFEHSPWIAREVVEKRPFSSVDNLFQTLAKVVMSSTQKQKEALINAHPRLGGSGKLTERSGSEQQQAGLRNLKKKEAAALAKLNAEYEQLFDFPFIMAIRGRSKQEIYSAMEKRLKNSQQKEFEIALDEILKIARLRLDDLFKSE